MTWNHYLPPCRLGHPGSHPKSANTVLITKLLNVGASRGAFRGQWSSVEGQRREEQSGRRVSNQWALQAVKAPDPSSSPKDSDTLRRPTPPPPSWAKAEASVTVFPLLFTAPLLVNHLQGLSSLRYPRCLWLRSFKRQDPLASFPPSIGIQTHRASPSDLSLLSLLGFASCPSSSSSSPSYIIHGFYFSLSNLFQISFLLLHPLNPGFYLEKRLLWIDQKTKKEQIISLLLFFKRVPKLLHF